MQYKNVDDFLKDGYNGNLNGFTANEFKDIKQINKELKENKTGQTIHINVARFFDYNGYDVNIFGCGFMIKAAADA